MVGTCFSLCFWCLGEFWRCLLFRCLLLKQPTGVRKRVAGGPIKCVKEICNSFIATLNLKVMFKSTSNAPNSVYWVYLPSKIPVYYINIIYIYSLYSRWKDNNNRLYFLLDPMATKNATSVFVVIFSWWYVSIKPNQLKIQMHLFFSAMVYPNP